MSENDRGKRVVVVGYDGFDPSREALVHAVERAGAGGEVVVVHAYPPPSHRAQDAEREEIVAEHRARGRELLAQAATACARASEQVSCETTLIEDRPVEALIDVARARGADEIVVGSRGAGRGWKPIGSVSAALLLVADRPVVVVSVPAPRGEDASAGG